MKTLVRLLLGVSLLQACTSDTQYDDIEEAPDAKSDVIRPQGEYRNTGTPAIDDVMTLILEPSDRTFYRVDNGGQLSRAPYSRISHQSDGTYRFSASADGRHRYIRFYVADSDGTTDFMDRFEYKLSGDTLKLRADGESSFIELAKYQVCVPDDCTGPAPRSPSMQCSDGSIAGPRCSSLDDGTCGWTIRTCPE